MIECITVDSVYYLSLQQSNIKYKFLIYIYLYSIAWYPLVQIVLYSYLREYSNCGLHSFNLYLWGCLLDHDNQQAVYIRDYAPLIRYFLLVTLTSFLIVS